MEIHVAAWCGDSAVKMKLSVFRSKNEICTRLPIITYLVALVAFRIIIVTLVDFLELNLCYHTNSAAIIVQVKLIKHIAELNLHILNNCNHSWIESLIAKFMCESFTPYSVKYII